MKKYLINQLIFKIFSQFSLGSIRTKLIYFISILKYGFNYTYILWRVKKITDQKYQYDNSFYKKKNQKFLKNIIIEKSNTDRFLNLLKKYYNCRYYGNFQNLVKIRKNLNEIDIFNLNIDKNIKIELLFEQRKFSELIKYFDYYLKPGFKQLVLRLSRDVNETTSCINEEYKEYIKNKKIRFIGPGPSSQSVIKNSNTLLIKNNANIKFLKKDNLKIDIVYFNGLRTRQFPEDVIDCADSVDWVILKDRSVYEMIKNKLNRKKAKIRYISDNFQCTNIFGGYNFLPLIIADNVIHKSFNFEILNINFYSDFKAYDETYRNFKQAIDQRKKEIQMHDPIKTFEIVKYFYLNNFIKVDESVKKIIDLPTLDYAKKLDQIYFFNDRLKY
jgi:hypothetical protein